MPRWNLVPPLAVAAAIPAIFAVVSPQPGAKRRVPLASPNHGLSPHLVIYRKQGVGAMRLPPGATVHRDDIVQVSYVAAGNHHGVVVSVDGAGVTSLHHPGSPSDPTRLEPRGEHPLPDAFQFDGAPHFERFYFVTSARDPIDVDAVIAAARDSCSPWNGVCAAQLELPSGLHQWSIALRKGAVH